MQRHALRMPLTRTERVRKARSAPSALVNRKLVFCGILVQAGSYNVLLPPPCLFLVLES